MDKKIKTIALTGLLTACVVVGTMIVKIPIPATGGYIHPGDGVVLLCGLLLGPIYGPLAAGLGSMLADLFSGYVVYAPATFIIKALTAAAASLLFPLFIRKSGTINHRVALGIAGGISELLMVSGYFIFETFLLNAGAAAAGISANLIQGVFGIILVEVLYPLLNINKE